MLALLLVLAASAAILHFALPKEAVPWQRLFDQALAMPDDTLVARARERLWAGRLEVADSGGETFITALERATASPYCSTFLVARFRHEAALQAWAAHSGARRPRSPQASQQPLQRRVQKRPKRDTRTGQGRLLTQTLQTGAKEYQYDERKKAMRTASPRRLAFSEFRTSGFFVGRGGGDA